MYLQIQWLIINYFKITTKLGLYELMFYFKTYSYRSVYVAVVSSINIENIGPWSAAWEDIALVYSCWSLGQPPMQCHLMACRGTVESRGLPGGAWGGTAWACGSPVLLGSSGKHCRPSTRHRIEDVVGYNDVNASQLYSILIS